ncbi:MAG: T9SS type A sorting domain-containing protein [Bacteroidales bacterium]|jgi:hypothetical protein|nr:T9SS type A sorting domain-containing protein [Bacteroidales bacterium]MDD3913969.1 T9SS type A sorting domain-containing protein [Bacteroidales bacterium]MDD4633761.1 T9SS type A sorting domain-containing protein [Bacteroidales bacterium]
MKKILLFVLVALIASAGISQSSHRDAFKQVAQKERSTGLEQLRCNDALPLKGGNMLSSETFELGMTYYDWQTNSGARNHIVSWEDGFISAVFTQALDATYATRGTGLATYNGSEWTPSEGRIESQRTGFGAIARYGASGLVIASHGSAGLIIATTDSRDGGTWTEHTVPSGGVPMWASVMTSGENRDIIHILATTNEEYLGQNTPLLYFRTSDGGNTWDYSDFIIEDFVGPAVTPGIGSNSYCFMETTEDNRLAFVIADDWIDGQVVYSDDNGDTWNSITYFDHPDPFATYDAIFLYPRWVSPIWDKDGYLHIAYEFNGTTGEPGSGSYYPGVGGVAYWNEDMAVLDTGYLYQDIYASLWYYSDATHEMYPEYIGYVTPLDESGNPEDPYTATEFNIDDFTLHGSYNCGIAGMPSMFYDKNTDRLHVVWIAMCENNQDEVGNFYFRIFSRTSLDRGETWQPMYNLTQGFLFSLSECVYPALYMQNHGNQLRLIYQEDGQTGTFVMNNDSDGTDNLYKAMFVDIDGIIGIKEYQDATSNIELSVYPNPASDYVSIELTEAANVTIYNSIGQVVKSVEHQGGVLEINTNNFNTGVYFVNANNGVVSTTQKLIVK